VSARRPPAPRDAASTSGSSPAQAPQARAPNATSQHRWGGVHPKPTLLLSVRGCEWGSKPLSSDTYSTSQHGRKRMQVRCPHCGQLHRECAFAFPPRGLLAPFVAKARSDGLRGVIVVPFAPSGPAWPTLAAASRTSVIGQRDPCVIVPNSREYARGDDDLGGAQRLAVMAVDFSWWSPRSFEGVAAPCGRHCESRASQPLHGAHDAGGRRCFEEALFRLGRPGHKRPRAGRGW
jgi:hypothetical protein